VAVTAVSGAFVAGLDAGHAYNTFPLMDGRIVPAEYWGPYSTGWLDNAFEHTAAVQFHHRVLALSTLGCVTALWAATRRATGLPARTATLLHGMLGMTYMQVRVALYHAYQAAHFPPLTRYGGRLCWSCTRTDKSWLGKL
jgi:cytochrome c oxidase assembly protein subunit 15